MFSILVLAWKNRMSSFIINDGSRRKMDISTIMTVKNKPGEINANPVPERLKSHLAVSGMWICSLYDNVSASKKTPTHDRVFKFYVIVHLLDGTAFYWNERLDSDQSLRPGDGIMVTPGTLLDYGATDDRFREDSIGFLGPTADALRDASIIQDGVLRIGGARRLLPIIEKVRLASTQDLLEANAMLQNLLFELHHERRRERKRNVKFKRLHALIQELRRDQHRWWSVREMAEYCYVSENHLRRLFKENTGMNPKNYVDNLKIRQAIAPLCESGESIADIASRLGFVDPYHFSRRFKRIMGIPPGQYRRRFGCLGE